MLNSKKSSRRKMDILICVFNVNKFFKLCMLHTDHLNKTVVFLEEAVKNIIAYNYLY